MKWNEMPVFSDTFLHYESWIGPGITWANEVKFLWNLPQSSIDPATFYSDSSVLPLDHGSPQRERKLAEKDGSKELVFISANAPTLVNNQKDPNLREEFYEELDTNIFKTNSRSLLIVAGDFNAKTGSAYKQYPENMGTFW